MGGYLGRVVPEDWVTPASLAVRDDDFSASFSGASVGDPELCQVILAETIC